MPAGLPVSRLSASSISDRGASRTVSIKEEKIAVYDLGGGTFDISSLNSEMASLVKSEWRTILLVRFRPETG